MLVQKSGKVVKVFKHPETNQWHIKVKSGGHIQTYIGFKNKPKVKEGTRVKRGDELQ